MPRTGDGQGDALSTSNTPRVPTHTSTSQAEALLRPESTGVPERSALAMGGAHHGEVPIGESRVGKGVKEHVVHFASPRDTPRVGRSEGKAPGTIGHLRHGDENIVLKPSQPSRCRHGRHR
jgi:hypothetical protein